MRVILETQRAAFLRAGAPSLEERRADLARLAGAIRHESGRIADVISADFGHRSRHETETRRDLSGAVGDPPRAQPSGRWMRPKRVPVGLELMPARAAILHQPLGVVGIIAPWNYPLQLTLAPLIGGARRRQPRDGQAVANWRRASPRCWPSSSPACFAAENGGRPSSAATIAEALRRAAVRPSALHRLDRGRPPGRGSRGGATSRRSRSNSAASRPRSSTRSRRSRRGRRAHRLRQAAQCRPDLHRAGLRAAAARAARRSSPTGCAADAAHAIRRSTRTTPTTPRSSTSGTTRGCASLSPMPARKRRRASSQISPADERCLEARASFRRRW